MSDFTLTMQSESITSAVSADLAFGGRNEVARRGQAADYGWNPVAISRTSIILGCVLVAFQILDGILTAEGITRYGVAIEGNVILRHLMHLIGPYGALICAKSLASLVVVILVTLTPIVSWLETALKAIALVYLLAAILPWLFILFV